MENQALNAILATIDGDHLTICANDETLESIWRDLYDEVNEPSQVTPAAIWVKSMEAAIYAALPDARINRESSFQYWHGGHGGRYGVGQQFYITNCVPTENRAALENLLSTCAATADEAARAFAENDIAAWQETEEEEE